MPRKSSEKFIHYYKTSNGMSNPFANNDNHINTNKRKKIKHNKDYNLNSTNPVINSFETQLNLDRFIPMATSKNAYRSNSPKLKNIINDFASVNMNTNDDLGANDNRLNEEIDSNNFTTLFTNSTSFFSNLRYSGFYDPITSNNRTPVSSLTMPHSSTPIKDNNSISLDDSQYKDKIANSLGFIKQNRVLNFNSSYSYNNSSYSNNNSPKDNSTIFRKDKKRPTYPMDIFDPFLYNFPNKFNDSNDIDKNNTKNINQRPTNRIKSHIPYRVLDAPNLRNDFYSNLISWSITTNNIIVALGYSVYIWSDKIGAIPILNNEYLSTKNDIICSISSCPFNDLVLVGTKKGKLLLFNQTISIERQKIPNNNVSKQIPLFEYQSNNFKGIGCIKWFKEDTKDINKIKFIIGEENGDVTFLNIIEIPPKKLYSKNKYDSSKIYSKRIPSNSKTNYYNIGRTRKGSTTTTNLFDLYTSTRNNAIASNININDDTGSNSMFIFNDLRNSVRSNSQTSNTNSNNSNINSVNSNNKKNLRIPAITKYVSDIEDERLGKDGIFGPMFENNSDYETYTDISTELDFESNDTYSKWEIVHISSFQAQTQQICGISINEDCNLLAVGGNDNSCTLWDITATENPILNYTFPHTAAVKAVSFCPWSKSLLATGGGSKDRKIKFWHTTTGTLIKEVSTKGQITSLIWSTRYKQLVATFGFGDIEKPILATLYSFPSLNPLMQVTSPTPIRALCAVTSPNDSSICVATNDETIRFYDLWSEKEDIINEANEPGLFGSNLIEHMEGINVKREEFIR
ncbi:hypothetical protein TBLA_0B07430 [Henningerozyma blattae CBS 6284]|uniref:Uncharacterized protein n=1 Tax=Henningerozyma blattae (strain ATCC 34711 / CBS 6284 / DSM 70876 / NBRC 10599 / NRRL Y-10934 / UCD 77-7) TaxID=1071380 RepID=I2GZK9_HENB6|nr:hypothetical protein TBLA_0B07430 [Tetrapisispora blattae CBS 6284]CCH59561.1 hypothetical protein TBLA_0B07430 [Tetrapisispora blattae CBS 6284]